MFAMKQGWSMEQELLTSSEAAAYLGVTRQRVDQLGQEGELPRQRMGHFWVYKKVDLDRWNVEPNRRVGRPKNYAGTLARAALA